MSDLRDTIDELLRLDEEATPGVPSCKPLVWADGETAGRVTQNPLCVLEGSSPGDYLMSESDAKWYVEYRRHAPSLLRNLRRVAEVCESSAVIVDGMNNAEYGTKAMADHILRILNTKPTDNPEKEAGG